MGEILFLLIMAALFGPAIILFIIGAKKKGTDAKAAKKYFILAVVYILISCGTCLSLIL